MKPPKNFYSNLDRRKQGLPEVPEASAADAGKIIKVGSDGGYELGEDENTIIIPNPETSPSETLNTLTIGNTTYKVNEARVTKLLGLRFTINNGGTYNANLPIVSLVDIYGNAAVLPVYTMTCDKNIQYGGLTLAGTPGVLNENLPAAFTVIFNAEFTVEDYPNIKFSKTGLFPADSAKNLKIEYTLDSENWVEIADLVSIDWSEDYHVYDMSTGEEVETIPEIPTPTDADAGKFLGVDNNGAWELAKIPSNLICAMINNISYDTSTDKYSGNLSWKDSDGNTISLENIGNYIPMYITFFGSLGSGESENYKGIGVLREPTKFSMMADFQTIYIGNSSGFRFTTKNITINSSLSTISFKVVAFT